MPDDMASGDTTSGDPPAGTVPPEDSWFIECAVTLTQAEVDWLSDLATARHRAGRGQASGWWMFGVQVGLGFLVALVAVATDAVEPERGGVVVVTAWLACWAAMAVYARVTHRAWRRHRMTAWSWIGYAYRIGLRPTGVHVSHSYQETDLAWHGFSGVECRGGHLLLWTRSDTPVLVPARALPPGRSAQALAAWCTERIAAEAPG